MVVSIDSDDCEERYERDLPSALAPDQLYLRAWADSLLNSAVSLLRRDYVQAGKSQLLESLLPHLAGGAEGEEIRMLFRRKMLCLMPRVVEEPVGDGVGDRREGAEVLPVQEQAVGQT